MPNDIQTVNSSTPLMMLSQEDIQRKIYTIRGMQVMLDRDLAKLFQVETKALNQAVKRNIKRFPERFMFQLTKDEWEIWKSQFVTINVPTESADYDQYNVLRSQNVTIETDRRGRHTKYLPYAFTEQGVSQLSSVLKSDVAIEMSVRIMDAFVAMRRFISANAGMFQRIESLERHQLETDQKIDRVLDCLEAGTLKEKAHIFSAGQIYEAKAFITNLIGKAKSRIILIDGYVSSPTIDLLDARQDGVTAIIYTCGVGSSLKALQDQYNLQFPSKLLQIKKWTTEQHDRWLIIDNELWHCGASIRDAGIRTFGIDPIGLDANIILNQVR